MPYKEKEIEKLYFTIGEVAKMFDVNTSHIRFWSKEFDVIKPATNKKGNRLYTQSDIDNFKKIYHLVKEKGFTLKGAKVELKTEKHKHPKLLESMKAPETTVHEHAYDSSMDLFAPPADDYVEKIALMNSLQKIRKSLVDIQGQLTELEVE
jgi:DNA-binding transcriptional MerR regulator